MTSLKYEKLNMISLHLTGVNIFVEIKITGKSIFARNKKLVIHDGQHCKSKRSQDNVKKNVNIDEQTK